MPMTKDQECIRLRTEPLARAVKQHAKQWMDCYGKVLLESSTAALKELHEFLEVDMKILIYLFTNITVFC